MEIAQGILKKYFGYDEFRSNQWNVIEKLLDGNDVLVIMPTGGGKSLCFQLPPLIKNHLAIVISPLIALMKDQVDSLKANGINANFLNSTTTLEEKNQIFLDLKNNQLRLLYISPEFLSGNLELVKTMKPCLFAVDEAHCISSWGHDFREEYKNLSVLKKYFPKIPIIALTATADNAIQKDILNSLEIHDAIVFKSSFDRPNIFLEVRPGNEKLRQIVEFIKIRKGEQGIIYCLSRKGTESLVASLRKIRIKAKAYHAGLEQSEREKVQNEFFEEKVKIVVATVAFGMGIDKSNVRFVIHFNIPKNLESYYQEIGRAGRDGDACHALLFFSFADIIQYRRMITGTTNELVLSEKLNRMYEFANASFCRRKILLGYFQEHVSDDCQNCDICLNPPSYINGTIIAQKVLSAIYKIKESGGINTLINVLRGSKERGIIVKGYNKLSVYGICNDLSYDELKQYINQLINLGLIHIAYDQYCVLKLTEISKDVLFDNKCVHLTIPVSDDKKLEQTEKSKSKKSIVKKEYNPNLLQALKELRSKIAKSKGLPHFMIFSDQSLINMAQTMPTNKQDFAEVNGVGVVKLEKYYKTFTSLIKSYV